MSDDLREEILREKQRRKIKAEKRRRKRILRAILAVFLVILAAGALIGGDILFRKWKDGKAEKKEAALVRQEEASTASISGALDQGMEIEEPETETLSAAEEPSSENAAEPTTEPEPLEFTIDMTFVGDCCMGTNSGEYDEGCMAWYMDNYPTTYFFDNVRYIFEADDFTLANCEGAFSDRDLPLRDKGESGFWFKSKAKNARIFADNSIEFVSIDNNHSHDYLEEGFADTKAALEAAGVEWGFKEKLLYFEKNGYTVAVVCTSYYGENEVPDTLPWLQTAVETSDFQIVYFHGGTEGSFTPDYWKVNAAHLYIDNGADLIIGHHPHVLQPREVYNGVDIIYSLGNFCFGGNNYPNRYTMIYKYVLTIRDGKLADQMDSIIPCYVFTGNSNNWQPDVIEDSEEKQKVLDFMNGERVSLP